MFLGIYLNIHQIIFYFELEAHWSQIFKCFTVLMLQRVLYNVEVFQHILTYMSLLCCIDHKEQYLGDDFLFVLDETCRLDSLSLDLLMKPLHTK